MLFRSSRSKAGKASAAKRALNKEISTSVEHLSTDVQQNPTKERKGKEIKENENKERIKEDINVRKLKFSESLKPFLETYGKDFLNDFYKYWTEPNKSNSKFRQELEKTWDLSRRLETWAKNEKNF